MKSSETRAVMRLWAASPPQNHRQHAAEEGGSPPGVGGGEEGGPCVGGPAHRKSERWRKGKRGRGGGADAAHVDMEDVESGGGGGTLLEASRLGPAAELTEVRVVVEDVSGDEGEGVVVQTGGRGGVSLPLLQVWPIDRGLADGTSFVFPPKEGLCVGTEERRDSGIDSFQASPIGECSSNGSGAGGSRRESTHAFHGGRLLHPNSARFLRRSSSDRSLNAASSGVGADADDDEDGDVEDEDDDVEDEDDDVEVTFLNLISPLTTFLLCPTRPPCPRANNPDMPPASPLLLPVSLTHAIPTARRRSSASSYARRASSASSARSDAAPWPCSPPPSSCSSRGSRRRVSLLMDALDLEYSTRGSVGGVRSFSGSFQKLTFTQSLAFPGLAAVRGLRAGHGDPPGRRNRRSFSSVSSSSTARSGLNAFAKVVTTVVLVLISVLVFGIVYKYVRT
ncbi:uncharacterized protein LOC124168403 [Ischnura elegans]|uniref:uncharacterized protein LOC124168403 n=1 Tax=Ischnura elegans TaxID=197161 RepID=UPI001ED86A18|nr:uncharacterized protein LOC124168403 [Ischnura elegans]